MVVNDPETLAQAIAAFEAYETALLANDNATLEAMFMPSPLTIRYGVAEVQHGYEEIRAFRKVQAPFERQLARTVITTYGTDFAVASTLFFRNDFPGEVGRQMQTWVRSDDGWKVAAAHVSMMPETRTS
ncbi:oxalurate catabolism protein HpxZ [Aquibium sp. ELW1220]|uniref:oxalurate catabolism protein HpxZ n=1 Tax=Aquibium sp. ELW1220 TaxID=2976766 RepID=UPI0025AFDCF3|nr:oxalurate catabolism protein HpxZ [Aquibium sp. ELW1220]MDN2581015.1 oxalurate catabolism protein HpxZ [Aquibium sp. ELW1220]